jgi:hypothetical protein
MVTTLSQHVLQHLKVQRLIGHDALQSTILVLEGTQALRIAHLKAAVLLPPAIERLARDPMAANHLTALARPFRFLQDRDDLLFREPRLPHGQSSAAPAAPGTVNLRMDR